MTDSLENHITAAKEGNQRAFSALLDAYWSDVYNFQLKRVGDEQEAEDITVQTFARAFSKIELYDVADNHFKAHSHRYATAAR